MGPISRSHHWNLGRERQEKWGEDWQVKRNYKEKYKGYLSLIRLFENAKECEGQNLQLNGLESYKEHDLYTVSYGD